MQLGVGWWLCAGTILRGELDPYASSSCFWQTVHIDSGDSRAECRYHRVFDSHASQTDVYGALKDCAACVDGFNSTLCVGCCHENCAVPAARLVPSPGLLHQAGRAPRSECVLLCQVCIRSNRIRKDVHSVWAGERPNVVQRWNGSLQQCRHHPPGGQARATIRRVLGCAVAVGTQRTEAVATRGAWLRCCNRFRACAPSDCVQGPVRCFG
jgi:hypothetical protein